jgi:hypothetical protein
MPVAMNALEDWATEYCRNTPTLRLLDTFANRCGESTIGILSETSEIMADEHQSMIQEFLPPASPID